MNMAGSGPLPTAEQATLSFAVQQIAKPMLDDAVARLGEKSHEQYEEIIGALEDGFEGVETADASDAKQRAITRQIKELADELRKAAKARAGSLDGRLQRAEAAEAERHGETTQRLDEILLALGPGGLSGQRQAELVALLGSVLQALAEDRAAWSAGQAQVLALIERTDTEQRGSVEGLRSLELDHMQRLTNEIEGVSAALRQEVAKLVELDHQAIRRSRNLGMMLAVALVLLLTVVGSSGYQLFGGG